MNRMRRDPLERLTIRAALVLGFGLVVGLWVFTGYAFTNRMTDTERRTSDVTRRYLQAQDALSAVRLQLNVSSIALRDALLDPNPANEARHLKRLEDSYATINKALDEYQPVLDTRAEPVEMDRLRTQIADLRKVTLEVLSAYHADRSAPAARLLEEWITPRRSAAIAVSDEIRALNRRALVQHQIATAEIHRAEEQLWWQRLGMALAGTIGIAFLAVLYAGRLEDRLRRERDKDAQHTRDLQRLSARLVAAQEEERRNIARELHDEVGQVLTAIKVDLQMAQRSLDAQGHDTQVLSDLQQMTDGALGSVRNLSHLLRPTMLDDLGLGAAIDWQLRSLARRHHAAVELLQEGMTERLDPDTEVAAFRIVQEALTNVARHAHATRCTVRLSHAGDRVVITVEDDGRGFDPAGVERRGERRGLGLIGLRERVAEREGTLSIESAPGQGTRVVVELPVRDSAPQAQMEEPDAQPMGVTLASPKVSHG